MKTILRSAAFAVLLSAGGATIGVGQAINACYVPAVGALYLVGLTGLSTTCVAPGHVAINLSSGSTTLGEGVVATANLADGAVTTAKIAAGTSVDRLGGIAASGFAVASHNHDGVYASLNHNHNSVYAGISHTHGTSGLQDGAVTTAKLAAPANIVAVSLAPLSNVTNTITSVGQVNFVIPGPGEVLVLFTGYFRADDAGAGVTLGLGSAATVRDYASVNAGGTGAAANDRHPFTVMAVVTYTSGGAKSIFANAQSLPPSALRSLLTSMRVMTLYIPN